MTKTVNDAGNQALVLPLTDADYAIAQQLAAQQPTPQKVEQVRLNTLAVSAVQTYLQMMAIPTDVEASESRSPFLSLCNDVADLVVTDVGHLECRPVRLHEQTCHIPAEVWEDRIGYVAVEIDEVLKEAAILGFTPKAEAEAFPLNQLQPLQQLLRHLSQLKQLVTVAQTKIINQPQVNLGQWLENVFEDGWQSIESLLGVESRNLAFSFRAVPSFSADEVSRSKPINLDPGSESETVLILVSLKAEIDGKIRVCVQIHPSKGNTVVSPCLKLALLSDSEEILQSIQAQSQDNYIQLKPFKCSVGTRFKLHISLNDFSMIEEFLV